MPINRLVLASASPYRREILERSGVPVEAIGATGDEKSVQNPDPQVLAQARARFKALDVLANLGDEALVIGADQVLSCDSQIFDKARDEKEARQHLRLLAGKTHWLHSAVVFAMKGPRGSLGSIVDSFTVNIPMQMRALSDEAITGYLASGEWQGSVGCYKIEGMGAQLFEAPLGDYYSIIGMPITELFGALRRVGVDLLANRKGPW